jgi:hypothetical protein
MKSVVLLEPELEFGGGDRHEDIRFGIMNYGPLYQDHRKQQIRIGIVGTGESIEGAKSWIERCAHPIPAKYSPHPNLFPTFPGFSLDTCFEMECVFPERGIGQLSERNLLEVMSKGGDAAIAEVVDMFSNELKRLDEKETLDVVICAIPTAILEASQSKTTSSQNGRILDFRGLLKAKAMKCRFPVQLLLPITYGGKGRRSIVGAVPGTYQQRDTQDEATRAWNFFVALIYKAGIAPWRLARESKDYESCFVGISFYRTLDSAKVMTSMAQVFNERGEGMIIRGDPVELTKDDPQPHLSELDSRKLLNHALKKYRDEHRHLPARVVLHKTSTFNKAETVGFSAAVQDHKIEFYDFLSLAKSGLRLFRHGKYPPLRGTYLHLDNVNHILYTRGSSEFYETYTGMYVPKALHFRIAANETGPERLAQEILALTKLNWNSTQIDGSLPITIRAARKVGDVLKYVPEDKEPRAQYSFYM